MNTADFTARLQTEMRDWSEFLSFRNEATPEEDLTDSDLAIEDASNETGWALPLTDRSRIYWFKQRCKRHLLFYLATGQSRKFQAKAFSLQHRFQQLKAMLDMMDTAWTKFQETDADMPGDPTGRFGTVIGTGIRYDENGNEYRGTPLVTIHPGDKS